MRAALLVFGYAVVLAWVLPLPLRRLSEAGLSPRLGLTAWLAALASVLGCALAALGLLIRAAVAGWPQFARSVCESVSAGACPPAVYRSSAYEAGLAGLLPHHAPLMSANSHTRTGPPRRAAPQRLTSLNA